MMIWTDEQIDSWCHAFQAYREEGSLLVQGQDLQQHQCRVRQEILCHLMAFLEGRKTFQDFTAAFDVQDHPDWNLLGIYGLSGSTFLKKLAQMLPQREQLIQHLRSVLLAPSDMQSAYQKMQILSHFLENIIATGQISRALLQPARVPSFLSLWWSIQNAEAWPRFTGDLRQHLLQKPSRTDFGDSQIDLYFAFRERFLALKTTFVISTGELERFLLWQKEREHKREKALVPASLPIDPSQRHHLQWLLAKIGQKVGCQVWIARQDHDKSWRDEILGQVSLPSFPRSDSVSDEALLEDIAVLWFVKKEIIVAYEIVSKEEEITASMLRLYDFSLTQARRRTRLCLVVPQRQFEDARRELSRPIFRIQQERCQCILMSEEHLLQNGEHILRWATSPKVIENMITFSMV